MNSIVLYCHQPYKIGPQLVAVVCSGELIQLPHIKRVNVVFAHDLAMCNQRGQVVLTAHISVSETHDSLGTYFVGQTNDIADIVRVQGVSASSVQELFQECKVFAVNVVQWNHIKSRLLQSTSEYGSKVLADCCQKYLQTCQVSLVRSNSSTLTLCAQTRCLPI